MIGSGDSLEALAHPAINLGIEEHVEFTGFIPDEDLVRYLSTADICLDPNPSSPLNDVSTWIKVMEYMALGKPIVSFDLKETENLRRRCRSLRHAERRSAVCGRHCEPDGRPGPVRRDGPVRSFKGQDRVRLARHLAESATRLRVLV